MRYPTGLIFIAIASFTMTACTEAGGDGDGSRNGNTSGNACAAADAGKQRCSNDQVQQCNDAGQWVMLSDCGASGDTCVDSGTTARCAGTSVCEAGDRRCAASTLQTCVANEFVDVEDCAVSQNVCATISATEAACAGNCDCNADTTCTAACLCDPDCSSTGAYAIYPRLADGSLGSICTSVDGCNNTIGDVPLFSMAQSGFLLVNHSANPVTVDLSIALSTGGTWDAAFAEGLNRTSAATLQPGGAAVLDVAFFAEQEGAAELQISLVSDATGPASGITATVTAQGLFRGTPQLEIAYYGATNPSGCNRIGVQPERCWIDAPLAFGGVAPGATVTTSFLLRNTASCPPSASADPCASCALRVAADPARDNIGLGFAAGSNADGAFTIVGAAVPPFDVQQLNYGCAASGAQSFEVSFTAPDLAGDYTASVVVETNDPQHPLVEFPMSATVSEAPVAIAGFAELDPANPGGNWTDPNDIWAGDTLYLDGRALGSSATSHDPSDPTDPTLIASYTWEVVSAPPFVTVPSVLGTDTGNGLFELLVPYPGRYVVNLRVMNTTGVTSVDSVWSRMEIVVPLEDRLVVKLFWDHPTNDHDLHLVSADNDARACNATWDCHWGNTAPIWFPAFAAGAGPNPSVDIDDTNGLGPEVISINAPAPGTYRLYIHYYGPATDGRTLDTVEVWIDSVLAGSYRRTLENPKDLWAVVDIGWDASNTATVTPYPSDQTDKIGAVATMDSCTDPGFTFPFP